MSRGCVKKKKNELWSGEDYIYIQAHAFKLAYPIYRFHIAAMNVFQYPFKFG